MLTFTLNRSATHPEIMGCSKQTGGYVTSHFIVVTYFGYRFILMCMQVLKQEFPPRSGYNSAMQRRMMQRSGRSRDVIISWNNMTPDMKNARDENRTFVARGGFFEGSVNQEYGSTVSRTPSVADTTSLSMTSRPTPSEASTYSLSQTLAGSVSERRYRPQLKEDWKTEAWRRANQEYRRYREATNLSGVPVNRRISNFEFGGHVVIG